MRGGRGIPCCGAGLVEGDEDRPGAVEKHLARRKEGHPARRSSEKRRSELVFEGADLAAHGRLRDVEAFGGASDVTLFGDGDEVTNLREAHDRSVPRRRADGKLLCRDRNGIGRTTLGWASMGG